MRGLVARMVVCASAVICAGAILAGQDLWYRSYQDAVKAFKSGDYATAETKFLAAVNNRNAPKERGRRVLYYGQIRDEFLPEYYLALVYDKLKRWNDAIKFASAADKYIKASDAESQTLTVARADAERGLTPTPAGLNAGNAGGSQQPPVVGNQNARGGGTQIQPADDPTAPRRKFDALVADVSRFTAAGQFAQARQAANDAKALGIDNAKVDTLVKNTDIQDLQAQVGSELRARAWTSATPLVERLIGLDPTNAVGRNARAAIAHGLNEDQARQIERDGLAAFYRGQYQRALDTLGKVAADVKTPRIVFYQACSTAALGLIQKDNAKLQKAHELFLQARPKDNPFTVERKYISPRITQVLDATS